MKLIALLVDIKFVLDHTFPHFGVKPEEFKLKKGGKTVQKV